jgi:hypothetical protein
MNQLRVAVSLSTGPHNKHTYRYTADNPGGRGGITYSSMLPTVKIGDICKSISQMLLHPFTMVQKQKE